MLYRVCCSLQAAIDRKSTLLNSSHIPLSRMPSFFFNDPATTEIYPLSLHDALPICFDRKMPEEINRLVTDALSSLLFTTSRDRSEEHTSELQSHSFISYAVFFF